MGNCCFFPLGKSSSCSCKYVCYLCFGHHDLVLLIRTFKNFIGRGCNESIKTIMPQCKLIITSGDVMCFIFNRIVFNCVELNANFLALRCSAHFLALRCGANRWLPGRAPQHSKTACQSLNSRMLECPNVGMPNA